MTKLNFYEIINYIIKVLIIYVFGYILFILYLYYVDYVGSLTLNRILIFILVYSRGARLIFYIFSNNKTLKKYIKDNNATFYKILYVLLMINPFIVFLRSQFYG